MILRLMELDLVMDLARGDKEPRRPVYTDPLRGKKKLKRHALLKHRSTGRRKTSTQKKTNKLGYGR